MCVCHEAHVEVKGLSGVGFLNLPGVRRSNSGGQAFLANAFTC